MEGGNIQQASDHRTLAFYKQAYRHEKGDASCMRSSNTFDEVGMIFKPPSI